MKNDDSMDSPVGAVFLLAWAIVFAAFSPSQASSPTVVPPGPGGYRTVGGDRPIQFPFDIYRGDIRFAAQINGRDVRLLLDDGFMWDQLLFWGGPEVDALELRRDGTFVIGESDDETALKSDTASGIALRLPGVEFFDQTAVITPASSGNASMWAGSIGQVSATFFKHFVVDINFDTMLITLIEPQNFQYGGEGRPVAWKPLEIGAWSIPGAIHMTDGRKISLEFMMDLGYNDQAQIATGGEHGFTTPPGAAPGSLGFNIQRIETRGHHARIAGVEIGGFKVEDVVASFVLEEHRDHTFHEVMIGLGLLSRFNLVFDASHNRLYVEPNSHFGDPFE